MRQGTRGRGITKDNVHHIVLAAKLDLHLLDSVSESEFRLMLRALRQENLLAPFTGDEAQPENPFLSDDFESTAQMFRTPSLIAAARPNIDQMDAVRVCIRLGLYQSLRQMIKALPAEQQANLRDEQDETIAELKSQAEVFSLQVPEVVWEDKFLPARRYHILYALILLCATSPYWADYVKWSDDGDASHTVKEVVDFVSRSLGVTDNVSAFGVAALLLIPAALMLLFDFCRCGGRRVEKPAPNAFVGNVLRQAIPETGVGSTAGSSSLAPGNNKEE